MSVLPLAGLLWAQVQVPTTNLPQWLKAPILWLFVLGEPNITDETYGAWFGAILVWFKIAAIFCLLGWVLSWVVTSLKRGQNKPIDWLDVVFLLALGLSVGLALLDVAQSNKRVREINVSGLRLVSILAMALGGVMFIWLERALWSSIRRVGTAADYLVLALIHVALLLGFGVAALMLYGTVGSINSRDVVTNGARLSVTYMGFVVLGRVAWIVLRELSAVRWRRIFAIAWLTVVESVRRMGAPWVVITVFVVVLAFTHWFLQPPRAAELGRLYVGTLSLLCSLLLTVMVTLLTPLSIPYDIAQQTIYTVVSKPVRRLEMIWGRIIGFMTIVTLLLALFGGIGLVYLWRTVQVGAIQRTEAAAAKARADKLELQAKQFEEEARQLRTRMQARVPVKGSLTFLDSRGTPQYKGIDVGQELEARSHIEGATQATAIWKFGVIPDPYEDFQARLSLARGIPRDQIPPPRLIDRRIPYEKFLVPDSIEGLQDRIYRLGFEIQVLQNRQQAGTLPANELSTISTQVQRNRDEIERLGGELKQLNDQAAALEKKVEDAEKANQPEEAQSIRDRIAALHSPPIVIEMNFNIYRTTKGIVGDPVFASLKAINPRTDARDSSTFPVREYYTNAISLNPAVLAGSLGDLRLEIQCISPTQYLGMAESDLYLLADSGNFGRNFMKGLIGVWLQAFVLTTIGVFAGTFLRWPVALLTTIAFFIAGQVAFAVLQQIALQSLVGGGPFESLIRLVTHDNQMSELTPTLGVVAARTMDSLVMPLLGRLVYVVPNFSALDYSNTVADGFAVVNSVLFSGVMLALGYAIPFSIAAYFILKNREVAA